ncbi:GAF domain-containing sensor histidine kinase [Geomonas sp.]|uniref:GAF domain-containing sensor histidine kinase n=1 Tax=Geomonas sp. TaxID=2651584 RepID=UPI002B4A94A0|nr:ATP-binding protein [Geomonas sp.]HJV34694.1 ATP-binding protein [Geomonas sp.]
MKERGKLLEQLTGVDSSKLNYYVELKKRNQEVLIQNSRLELLQQLTRDINIDMSIGDIIARAFLKLPEALPCDFLGIAKLQDDELRLFAMVPKSFFSAGTIPHDSLLYGVLEKKTATSYCPTKDTFTFARAAGEERHTLRSLAVAPMFERASASGVLILGSTQQSAYAGAELNFVQHLADQLAISLQNARLYKQVSRAKKEWEATFQAVTDPILLVDTDYNVLLHNDRLPPSMAEGWNRAISNKCFAKLRGLDEPCENCPIQEIKKTGKPVFQRWRTEEGNFLDLSYYPVLNEDKQLAAVTIIMKDVTKKLKMEAQLVQSAKMVALGVMAAGVAHELNSPMTVIIGTAQMLARDKREEDPEGAEALEDIINCGLRCKRIIQNLLTFSRQDQAPVAAIDLNAEAKRVLDMIKYQINRNQIAIVERFDKELPRLNANGPQIQQVLTNFLINARDALSDVERLEKTIEVTTAVSSEGGRRWVTLSVLDNGVGIAAENLSKIFTPFYTSKEASKGTGLGLSVSLGIAESHHGRIEVESRLGEGSCFKLILPLENDDAEPGGRPGNPVSNPGA